MLVAVVLACANANDAYAGAVVMANRTHSMIRFGISPDGGSQQAYTLEPNDVTPVEIDVEGVVAFRSDGEPRYYRIETGRVYFFHVDDDNALELDEIGFGLPAVRETPSDDLPPVATVPVKVLVDDDEHAVPEVWQARLRTRLEKANAILEHHARVRFEIVEFGTWYSNSATNEYNRSLKEFEDKVDPGKATIAIGFTSQYRRPDANSRTHLGGIRGPFREHILIREWPQHFSEPERLEVLVHELGHFLGAVHSPEATSVMRPNLGDRHANHRQFRIGFDPVNTLVMYLIGEQYRARPIRSLAQLSPATKAQLRAMYVTLAQALPTDPAARRYVQLMGAPPLVPN